MKLLLTRCYILAALEQLKDQATNMLQLLVLSEECEDSGTTQKKENVRKTPAKMLPSTLRKHTLYVKMYYIMPDLVHGSL